MRKVINEGEKAERIERTDLGLALLSIAIKPGQCLTFGDMAIWCGCKRQSIHEIYYSGMRKVRARLIAELGIEQFNEMCNGR